MADLLALFKTPSLVIRKSDGSQLGTGDRFNLSTHPHNSSTVLIVSPAIRLAEDPWWEIYRDGRLQEVFEGSEVYVRDQLLSGRVGLVQGRIDPDLSDRLLLDLAIYVVGQTDPEPDIFDLVKKSSEILTQQYENYRTLPKKK